jgi:metal-sulfur cluster biosynthetic enzyme
VEHRLTPGRRAHPAARIKLKARECHATMTAADMTEERIREALRNVVDPEVGVNIVDLGLVYGIRITPDGVDVDLTMTSPACPMGDLVIDDAREALRRIVSGPCEIRVNLVWDPPWDSSRMSERAKRTLGWE